MKNQIPTREERIEVAVTQVIEGIGEEKVKGIETLGSMKARPDLVKQACVSRLPKMRSAGALALGRFGERTDRLTLEQLTSDENPHVRTAACQGLGLGNFAPSYLLLIAIAEDGTEHNLVRTNAIIAAARIVCADAQSSGPTAVPTSSDLRVMQIAQSLYADQVMRFEAYTRALGALGCLASTEKLEAMANLALQTGLQDPRDAFHLLEALCRKPLTVQGQAIMALALDGLPGGRMQAIKALIQQPTELARKGLERSLFNANPERVRLAIYALCALGIQGSMDAIKPLFMLDDANSLALINGLEGSDSFDFCLEIAFNGLSGQRVAAIKKLWYLNATKAPAAIERLAIDSNAQVRYTALDLLIKHSAQPSAWRSQARDDLVPWVAKLGDPPADVLFDAEGMAVAEVETF